MKRMFSPITFGEQLKILQVGEFVLTETLHAPRLTLPRHDHECANMNFTLRGSFREIIGRRPQECDSLSILVKPAGEAHANQYGDAGAHCLIIEVKSTRLELIRSYSKLFDTPSHIECGTMSALAIKIYKEFRAIDGASALIIEGLVLEMLGQAARRAARVSSSTPPPWLREARDLLHEHFAQPVSLFNVAASVGVHPAHFARTFRKYYRCSVGEYVRRLRLEYAARELSRTAKSLAEISTDAGFYDQSHFTQVFKRHLSMTPAEFRLATRRGKAGIKKLQSSKTS